MTHSRSRKDSLKRSRRARKLEQLEAKHLLAADAFAAPEGGWAYSYEGDEDATDETATLDGGWTHTDNDQWDESAPGVDGTAPGGVISITEGDDTYLRIQDAGDPRDLGFPDPPSNRKISINRNLVEEDGISESFLDEGFTVNVRIRLATDGPLDDLTFDGVEEPWPENGRGSDIQFDGTGFFTINQKVSDEGFVGPISFALADPEVGLASLGDDAPEVGGLLFNNLVSNTGFMPSSSVDTADITDQEFELNLVPVEDLTEWHDFWITIQLADLENFSDGTHEVSVYADGSTEATTFEVTMGSASRFEDFCICPSFTTGATAVDIDFIRYANGVHIPVPNEDGDSGSGLSDVTAPGDALVRVDGENDGDGNDGPPPGAEMVENVINNVGQKHLNFLDLGSGFIVTPSAGPTLVTGLRLYPANDAIPRDPASYVLEGQSGEGEFVVISEGELSLPDERNAGGDLAIDPSLPHQEILFENAGVFDSYRLTFPTVKDADAANSMQIAEVEFLGRVIKSDVTAPGDELVRVDGENDGDGNDGPPPGAEMVENVINNVGQKHLNFLDLGSGFIVTPSAGETIVTGLRLFTANDAVPRDPASYVLEGQSGDGEFTVISQGDLNLPDERNPGGDTPLDLSSAHQEISFENSTAYTSYRLTFPTVKDADAANSMQIAEVEFLGDVLPPAIDLSGGTAAQSSQLNDFDAGRALDGDVNFTHTLAGDENPTWQVQLAETHSFDTITIFNRQASDGDLNCCPSRLRDITIQVVQFDGDVAADFVGGEVVAESELLNPENEIGGGTDADGPISLSFNAGGAEGNLIRVIRTPDPDLSGSGGQGNSDEGDVLSIDLVLARGTVVAGEPGLPADINGNGEVDFADFLILSENFGSEVEPGTLGDIDGNGVVEFADFLGLSDAFGDTAAADAVFAGE